MEEKKYQIEGKIIAAPKTVSEYQGKKKFGFKLENDEMWYNLYQPDTVSDEEFKKIMEIDFKRGFKIKFDHVQGIITEHVIYERNEEAKKSFGGGYPREDPKQKVAGMLISYAKDLVVADKIKHEQLGDEARRMLKLHQELSK